MKAIELETEVGALKSKSMSENLLEIIYNYVFNDMFCNFVLYSKSKEKMTTYLLDFDISTLFL